MAILEHKGDYSLLALGVGGYLIFIIRYAAVPRAVLVATIMLAVFYTLWGCLHHLRRRSLTGKVMLEYLLVSILAISIVSTLLV